MLPNSKSFRWSDLFSWTALSIFAALLLNIAVLISGAVWTAARRRINDEPYHGQPSNTELVFYTFTMPLLTFFQSPIDLACALRGMLSPAIALTTSTISLCGWVTQISFWFYCEVSSHENLEQIPAWCPNTSRDPDVG
ncbi:hypothetical protein K432DRAFT_403239 [Lepidopterella palustris CBS 459.81]|uniref:Uncharacterized protein n=1 Tax=Lepidopterella palustris CBS 459.81 TaxID=1314670 RepID=A0A8E2JGT6_9PEZI|nr:hypothetical protein K432DRAFT_403239 [Lepidopterella palustris CBS 459.81]